MVVFAMLLGISSRTLAGEIVTEEQAEAIANVNIGELTDSSLDSVGNVLKTYQLYDKSGNISAYYFQYSDAYIIVGANTQYYPIIEYSDDNNSFIEAAIKKYESEGYITSEINLYYTGDINYYIGVKNSGVVEVIGAQESRKVDISSLSNDDTEEKQDWNFYKNQITGSSTPINVIITNPDIYESQYYSKTSKDVPNYDIIYFLTSDFSGYSNHCSPTAGTNLLKYWYLRNNTKYNRLLISNDWVASFKKLYGYFKTTSLGTYDANLANGYYQYFRDCGIGLSKSQLLSNPAFSILKQEIDAGYPFHYSVYEHAKYKNHSVLALGYVTYTYRSGSSFTTSNYIRVVDGGSNRANRFIRFDEYGVQYKIQIIRPA